MGKNSQQKSYKQKKGTKWESFLFYTGTGTTALSTNIQKFLANNFFCVHFFPIVSTDLKSE